MAERGGWFSWTHAGARSGRDPVGHRVGLCDILVVCVDVGVGPEYGGAYCRVRGADRTRRRWVRRKPSELQPDPRQMVESAELGFCDVVLYT